MVMKAVKLSQGISPCIYLSEFPLAFGALHQQNCEFCGKKPCLQNDFAAFACRTIKFHSKQTHLF